MTEEEMHERAYDHLRQWYQIIKPDATMETIIDALKLIVGAIADSAPRPDIRNEFLDHMRYFIEDFQAGRISLKRTILQ